MNASLVRRPALVAPEAGLSASASVPAPHVYARGWRGAVVLCDLAALATAFAAAVALVWRFAGVRPSIGACLVAALLLVVVFAAHELHEKTYALLRRDEFYYALGITVLSAAVIVPGFFITDMSLPSRVAVGLGVLFSGATIGTTRYLLRAFAREERIFATPDVRVVTAPSGNVESWLDEVCRYATPTHVVISEPANGSCVNELARAAARRGIVVAIAGASYAPALSVRGMALGDATVLEVDVPRVCAPWARRTKRGFDILVASIALVFASPVLALAAIAICLEGRGPIVYSQPRVGLNGKQFRIYKLRSMRVDAEARSGPVWAVSGDARVTRVGRILRRTSIDELPQLINVLRGEMSIVGPRPERPLFVETFAERLPQYRERLVVAPGLTACSHLYMSRSVETDAVEQRLSYDLFYLRNWSPAMDVALMIKTAAEVVFHRAA